MTASKDPYHEFISSVANKDNFARGRLAVLQAGVQLVGSIASDTESGKDPQVIAAEITAIASLVGQYVLPQKSEDY